MTDGDLQSQIDELKAQLRDATKAILAQSQANAGHRTCPAYYGPSGKVPGQPGVTWCTNPSGEGHADDHLFDVNPRGQVFVVTEPKR